MLPKWFFIINGLLVLYLIWRLASHKKDSPTMLNVDAPDSPRSGPGSGREVGPKTTRMEDPFGGSERPLNCFFQYNGETWDAFEVLGVPGGCDRNTCHLAYLDHVRQKNSSNVFYDAAWQALEDYFKRHAL